MTPPQDHTDAIWRALNPPAAAERPDELLRALSDDWTREAQGDAETIEILAEDLAKAAQAVAPQDRLVLLRAQVVERQARRLSVESFELGKRAVRAGSDRASLADQARELLDRHQAIRSADLEIAEPLRDPETARSLHDAFLEATYALAGGATSPRLARWAADEGLTP